MKTKYLTLFLLLTCGIGRAQIDTHGKPVNCVAGGVPKSDPPAAIFTLPLVTSSTMPSQIINYKLVNGIWIMVGDVTLNHVTVDPDIRYCDDIKNKMHDESPCVQKRAEQEVQLDQIDFYKGWLEIFRKLAIKNGDYKP